MATGTSREELRNVIEGLRSQVDALSSQIAQRNLSSSPKNQRRGQRAIPQKEEDAEDGADAVQVDIVTISDVKPTQVVVMDVFEVTHATNIGSFRTSIGSD
eukprot:1117366-Rhodomonas_salina.2